MLAGDESALAVAGVAVGVVGGLTEDADPAGLLVPAHDAVIGNVAPQETARITEIDRALVKTAAGREPLDARKREPVAPFVSLVLLGLSSHHGSAVLALH